MLINLIHQLESLQIDISQLKINPEPENPDDYCEENDNMEYSSNY
jgi:hypothetical protein